MRLDKDPEMFRRIITNVALKQNILEVYVEKDYWLYLILKEIFKNNENGYVFKGGTSLSKCFPLLIDSLKTLIFHIPLAMKN